MHVIPTGKLHRLDTVQRIILGGGAVTVLAVALMQIALHIFGG